MRREQLVASLITEDPDIPEAEPIFQMPDQSAGSEARSSAPGTGRHPGSPAKRKKWHQLSRNREAGGLSGETGRYEVRKVEKVVGSGSGPGSAWSGMMNKTNQASSDWCRAFGIDPKTAKGYLPIYFVFKDGLPYLAHGDRHGRDWYNTDQSVQYGSRYSRLNRRARFSPGNVSRNPPQALLQALEDAGVPEEMMPPVAGGADIGDFDKTEE
jgi:hypothetical protein